MGLGLKGKTVGLIGLGGIGKALAKRLAAFDMRLIGIKQHIDPSFAKTHHLDWLGTLNELPILLQQADFVVLSLPDTPQTHHVFNQQTFRQMKAGSYLINLGRGGLIDKDALETALKTGHLAGAGLDVFWQEPPDPTDPIFQQNIIFLIKFTNSWCSFCFFSLQNFLFKCMLFRFFQFFLYYLLHNYAFLQKIPKNEILWDFIFIVILFLLSGNSQLSRL